MPIFRVKSVKIYTGQKKFTRTPSVASVTNIRYVWPLATIFLSHSFILTLLWHLNQDWLVLAFLQKYKEMSFISDTRTWYNIPSKGNLATDCAYSGRRNSTFKWKFCVEFPRGSRKILLSRFFPPRENHFAKKSWAERGGGNKNGIEICIMSLGSFDIKNTT